ncbi:MAG TPA: phenylalanine--tRNA ligase subunit alpha [Bacilli bacterium]|mgnify:CR=1 FL=1|nr:phenylalanine--tRNA ligase subunit alpha [Bacilli bacterium]HPS18985.1 phenylalanine--tRNA ligase subunit alpha [Bacilli bacterium]
MKNEKLSAILKQALSDIEQANSLEDINAVRNRYFAKKSELASLGSLISSLPDEEKKDFGREMYETKTQIASSLDEKNQKLAALELDKKLQSEAIDITLPGRGANLGARNPFHIIIDEITDIFLGMGYTVADGPEVESDMNNFELLNIPHDHPARDMQDSFYIDENTLLRTHTSAVQAHEMQKYKGQPIRVICPGKTFRRDDDDATHSHQFAQIEGLAIDKNLNIGNLKSTLELFVKKMFGEKREIRLRSSYFPFTEPSVEIDITCANCGGKGCPMCKDTGYIEILGGGMVNPRVLELNGYNPREYSGFAFGVGIERVAILRYGIDDIRKFYQNDVRFLHQFKKR